MSAVVVPDLLQLLEATPPPLGLAELREQVASGTSLSQLVQLLSASDPAQQLHAALLLLHLLQRGAEGLAARVGDAGALPPLVQLAKHGASAAARRASCSCQAVLAIKSSRHAQEAARLGAAALLAALLPEPEPEPRSIRRADLLLGLLSLVGTSQRALEEVAGGEREGPPMVAADPSCLWRPNRGARTKPRAAAARQLGEGQATHGSLGAWRAKPWPH